MPTLGEPFEKLVAQIQARIDPASQVTHNEFLTDRLGQRRQFDVVVRGQFAGQKMLGVVECKDLNRKVGTPEIDAFQTKAQDINANFKVIASKRGFTKPALHKAKHYGIRVVSLLDPEILNRKFAFGDWWFAKVIRWSRLNIQVHPADKSQPVPEVPPQNLLIDGKRVLDWFTNYLLREGHKDKTLGWVVGFQMTFDLPILITVSGVPMQCDAISFFAERECREYERFVPLSAEAFVDWHTSSATIPANTTISMEAVPTDFHEWTQRNLSKQRESCIFEIALEAHEHQFDYVADVPNLEAM
ncbi:MAG: restriction endonuclease [Georgfuchsia sp.]